jgi:hypothetical protein
VVASLAGVAAGELDAMSAMRVVDVEATRSGRVFVASVEKGREDVAST